MEIEYLRECFEYDHDTGDLIWKTRPEEHFQDQRSWRIWNTKYSGCIAGSVERREDTTDYIQVSINNATTRAHRVCFALYQGYWTDNQIDHMDGDGLNNRPDNLREVTNLENGKNQKLRSNNTSGHMGISWHKTKGYWQAYIKVDGRHIHLGSSKDFDEVLALRRDAEVRYGFHENHGR